MSKSKLFRDPVHGYIEIEEDYCKDFIDTTVFQRLRAIEQTSMRILYPAARHDRFIHSIGTFYMAKKVFSVIADQVQHVKNKESLEKTFLIAALLHDCAHSPFSHTGEEFMETYCYDHICEKLKAEIQTQKFLDDFVNVDAQVHEIASAYIALKKFKSSLAEHKIDTERFARMIIGLKFSVPNPEEKTVNCLISLINGSMVDVDKLDYLARDTWASGVNNISVDVDRLINGIELDVEDPIGTICIRNQALSTVLNASRARDFLYQWIISHHKVQYGQYILKKSIETLAVTLSEKYSMELNKVFFNIFSPDFLLETSHIGHEELLGPTDGDILYLIKKYCQKNPYTSELLARSPMYLPIWKTYPEYCCIFKGIFSKIKSKYSWPEYSKILVALLQNYCEDYNSRDNNSIKKIIIIPVKPKLSMASIDNLSVKIKIQDMTSKPAVKDFFGQSSGEIGHFAYLYLHKDYHMDIKKIIRDLKKQERGSLAS